MKIRVVNTPAGFIPETDDDADKKRRLRTGATYEVTVKEVRNPLFNRKFHAMIRTAWEYLTELEQMDFHNNVDFFRYHLEIEAGFCVAVYDCKADKVNFIPKSTAFDKMTESEFSDLYESIRRILIARFVGQENEEIFNNEIKYF